jgi:hypothetical protein
MSTAPSFLERFIRVLTRATQPKHDREAGREEPIRWLNLR